MPLRNDSIKHRLTDRADIVELVGYLRQKGMSAEALPIEIAKLCYVDLDELNDVLLPPLAAE